MLRVGLAAGSLGRALGIKKANLELLVEATAKGKLKLPEPHCPQSHGELRPFNFNLSCPIGLMAVLQSAFYADLNEVT